MGESECGREGEGACGEREGERRREREREREWENEGDRELEAGNRNTQGGAILWENKLEDMKKENIRGPLYPLQPLLGYVIARGRLWSKKNLC